MTKKRPALVIFDPDDSDVLLARISSQPSESYFDTVVQDLNSAGLRLPSRIRLHKLATLEKSVIYKSLGKLSLADLQTVRLKLQEMIDQLA